MDALHSAMTSVKHSKLSSDKQDQFTKEIQSMVNCLNEDISKTPNLQGNRLAVN